MRPIVTRGGSMVCRSVIVVSPEKMTELIEKPFGMWTQVGTGKDVLDEVKIGASWRTRLNQPCVTAMRSYVKQVLSKTTRKDGSGYIT